MSTSQYFVLAVISVLLASVLSVVRGDGFGMSGIGASGSGSSSSPPSSTTATCRCTDVIVRDRKLYVEGQEYFVKGVAYSPVPSGQPSNTGLCSWKLQVFGQMAPDCYGSDFFRWPAWRSVWERDIPLLAEAGFNTLRVYNMEFLDVGYAQKFSRVDPQKVVNPELAADHRPFMDIAHRYGMKVIIPVVQDQTMLTYASLQQIQMYIEGRVNELGNHPALLMWAVGNEMALHARPDLLEKVNWAMYYLRKYTLQRWNRKIPTTYFSFDYPPIFEQLLQNLKQDVFSINTYRGTGVATLFDGDGNFSNYSRQYNIPMLIGEWSVQNLDTIITQTPDVLNRVYRDIVLHAPDGCIGATYFQATDDITKPPADIHLGLLTQSVATNGSCRSDQNGCFIADGTSRKPIVFDSLKSGLPNSQYSAFNIQADVWQLNRQYGGAKGQITQTSIDISQCSAATQEQPLNGVQPQAFNGPQYGSNQLTGYVSPYLDFASDPCGYPQRS